MIRIDFPPPEFRLRVQDGREQIFDPIRRQWLVLSGEEWVRQNFVQFMVQVMQYPQELIAMEKQIRLGELKKRFDILVFDKEYRPWMLVECKAREVPLDENVLGQVLRYNISMPAAYLVITNGILTYGWRKAGTGVLEMEQMPGWPVLPQ